MTREFLASLSMGERLGVAAVWIAVTVVVVLFVVFVLPSLLRETWDWCQETFNNEPAELDRVIDFEKRRRELEAATGRKAS